MVRTSRFTAKQGQYLAFIQTYVLLHRRPPAEADMERYFGVTPPSVHRMVIELERRGLIRRTPGQARSIESTSGVGIVTRPPSRVPCSWHRVRDAVPRSVG